MSEITNFQIPFPDFMNGDVIDPEAFDENNAVIVGKLNQVVDLLNSLTADNGASFISLVPSGGINGNNVQEFLTNLLTRLTSNVDGTSGASLVHTSELGFSSTDLEGVLKQLKSLVDLKANSSETYTRDELSPFLSGGTTRIVYDVFTIVTSNNGDGTFTYKDTSNNVHTGSITSEGYQVFTLLSGTYLVGENRIKAQVNDVLTRSVASGGLIEISNTHVALTAPEGDGSEITFEYFERIGIAGEHNIIVGEYKPPLGETNTLWFQVI